MKLLNALGIVTVKKSAMAPNTLTAVSFTASHTAITLFLKSSFVAKSVINAATNAETTVITIPIGLAAIAVFNNFCAIVNPSVVVFHTLNADISPCIIVTTFHANIPAAIPAIIEIMVGPFFARKEINSFTLLMTASTMVFTSGILLFTSPITSLITGFNSSPTGFIRSTLIFRPKSSIWFPRSSYFVSFIVPSASLVAVISPCVFTRARTASSPKSSHLVPYSATPKRFLCTSLSHEKRAVFTIWNASFAPSPPCANFVFKSSTFNPRVLNASSAVPSFTLMPNSFTASFK